MEQDKFREKRENDFFGSVIIYIITYHFWKEKAFLLVNIVVKGGEVNWVQHFLQKGVVLVVVRRCIARMGGIRLDRGCHRLGL